MTDQQTEMSYKSFYQLAEMCVRKYFIALSVRAD